MPTTDEINYALRRADIKQIDRLLRQVSGLFGRFSLAAEEATEKSRRLIAELEESLREIEDTLEKP